MLGLDVLYSELQEFLPFWQGFLVKSVCWHQIALLQQVSYVWHTFMKVLAHEDEVNILKQTKVYNYTCTSCRNCLSQRTLNFLK